MRNRKPQLTFEQRAKAVAARLVLSDIPDSMTFHEAYDIVSDKECSITYLEHTTGVTVWGRFSDHDNSIYDMVGTMVTLFDDIMNSLSPDR